jgi:hypothetical protein
VSLRFGVDGVTASGKTTFADRLAALLGGVARISIDDFHRPEQARYYPDSFDLAAFRAAVLAAPTRSSPTASSSSTPSSATSGT